MLWLFPQSVNKLNNNSKTNTHIKSTSNKNEFHLVLIIVLLNLLFLCHLTNAQYNSEDDLAFNYKERSADEQQYARGSTKRGGGGNPGQAHRKPTTSTSKTLPKLQPVTHKQTTAAKLGSKLTSPLLQVYPVTPPFIYASETINQTHANMFKSWLDTKALDLYELSMNYSGYKLLNATYNVQLRKDAKFAWINFTEMIIDISNTISEVLYNKTLVVKNLTEVVERAFDEYRNDTRKIKESAKFVYYDAKSPKTFCDVQEASNARKANQTAAQMLLTTSTTTRTGKIGKATKAGALADKSGKNVTGKAANAGAGSVSKAPASAAQQSPAPAAPPPPAAASAATEAKLAAAAAAIAKCLLFFGFFF